MKLEADQEQQRLQLQAAKMDMALGWQDRQLEFQKKQLEVHNMQQDALLERRDKQEAAQLECVDSATEGGVSKAA